MSVDASNATPPPSKTPSSGLTEISPSSDPTPTANSGGGGVATTRSLDVDEVRDYLRPRALGLATTGALIGAIRGYYIAEKPLNFGYKFGIVSGAVSSTFYLGSYMLGIYRGKDDAINHATSGAINLTAISLLMKGDSYMPGVGRGIRHSAAALVGAVTGVLFFYGGSLLYDSSRAVWLYHRSYMVQTPRPAYGIGREKMTIPVMPPRAEDVFHVTDMFKSKSKPSGDANSNASSGSNNSSSNSNNNNSNNSNNNSNNNSTSSKNNS